MNLQQWKDATKKERFEDVLSFFGTLSELARYMGVTYEAARRWKKNGCMPEAAALELEKKTRGHFTARYLNPTTQDYFDRFQGPKKAGVNAAD